MFGTRGGILATCFRNNTSSTGIDTNFRLNFNLAFPALWTGTGFKAAAATSQFEPEVSN